MIILLLDVGTGNLRSVYKSLESLGAQVRRTSDPKLIALADKIILPGVGAFGDFMLGLQGRGLDQSLLEYANRGRPLLGICVGMQVLFEVGEEMGNHLGLGLLPGRVVRFPNFTDLKVPHTGWNQIEPVRSSPLLCGLGEDVYAYFNHSFYCLPSVDGLAAALTNYGLQFTSLVQRDNIFGVQFHPEKSQKVGLKILENFLAL